MLRTRILWFTLGFGTTSTAISHFVWKDLWVDRHHLSLDMKRKFDVLDGRVSNLESILNQNSTSDQAEG
ncbi:hypothetical protein L6164_002929 [Bauhinia variegata]|uniref:Uncharacterized protein n=1 Tax=Bauhinia variegata TaxID=167791 RepID=A0ACB9PZU5_BAUVA|nr:hypothetical protein L6164_002929 [Bauhinia variegata]